jgi:hypothetical protein
MLCNNKNIYFCKNKEPINPNNKLLSYINKVNNDILIHKRPIYTNKKFINYKYEYHNFLNEKNLNAYDIFPDVLSDYCIAYPSDNECLLTF